MSVHVRVAAGLCGLALLLAAVVQRSAQAEPAAPAACTSTLAAGGDVQHAIDSLPAGPATLCLAAGEFPLHRLLSIDRNDVALRGQGASTVLRLDHGLESPVIVIGDYRQVVPQHAISNVRVENLRAIGGGWDGRESDPDYPFLMNSVVAVRDGHQVLIRGLQLSDCRSACILTEHGSSEVDIDDNTASAAYWDGVSLNDSSHIRVSGNTLRDNKAAGITIEHLEDSRIDNNQLSDNGSAGIYLSNAQRNEFAGNHIADNHQAGVFLTCAVVQLESPARCFTDTMSQANRFERNEFLNNKYGYVVAPNPQATCTKDGFVRNQSHEDRFVPDHNREADWVQYGHCLEYADPLSG